MKNIIAIVLFSNFLSFAQLMVPNPNLDMIIPNLEKLNIEGGERLCSSPSAVTVTQLSEGRNTPPASFITPNLALCADRGQSRITAMYAEPNHSWLREHGVQFSTYTYQDGPHRFSPLDMVQDGIGNWWVLDKWNGVLINLYWDWSSWTLLEDVEQRITGLNEPTALLIQPSSENGKLELIVVESGTSSILVFDPQTKDLKRSIEQAEYEKLTRIASVWNPMQPTVKPWFYATDQRQLFRIRSKDLTILDQAELPYPELIVEDLFYAPQEGLILADRMTGKIHAWAENLSVELWATPEKTTHYIDGELPVFFRPQALNAYFDHLIVAEPIMWDRVGVRAAVFHEKVPLRPELIRLEDDCKGKKIATFSYINENPGKVYVSESNNYFSIDGKITAWGESFSPKKSGDSYTLSTPFSSEAFWYLDGNTASTQGVSSENQCPVLAIVPRIDRIQKYCNGGKVSYRVLLGYDNPNPNTVEMPSSGEPSKFHPDGMFGRFNNIAPTTFLPGNHSALDPGSTINPIYVQDFQVGEGGDINQFQWQVLSRVTNGNGGFEDLCILEELKLNLQLKDAGYHLDSETQPRIRLSNLSETAVLDNISIRFWLSMNENPGQKMEAVRHWSDPANIQISTGVVGGNEFVEVKLPADFEIKPGETYGDLNLQIGIHIKGWWPGVWDKSNDWSFAGVDSDFRFSDRVTVYSAGEKVYGVEPQAGSSSSSYSSSSMGTSSSSSADSIGTCRILGSGPDCPFVLGKDLPFKVQFSQVGSPVWIKYSEWPGMNNPWWTANLVLLIDQEGSLIPQFQIDDGASSQKITGGGWFHQEDIVDQGPILIKLTPFQTGSFTLRLSTQ